jgi:eukaryotic-like serine/threonine-protein kinase
MQADRVGKYRIIALLGQGGMASVFLSVVPGPVGVNKLLVVKLLRDELSGDEDFVAMFLNEARLAARLNHANVVHTYEVGVEGGRHFLAMDYLDGQPLHALLRKASRAGMPLDVHVRILAETLAGLHYAHTLADFDGTELRVVHRDVSPQNVFVTYDGQVKVVDFGIAKAANQVHYTAIGETKGTPSMMAPEQRVGEQVDVRADVYSAAAVGYEIVTGHSVNLDLAALAHLGIENWPHLPLPSSMRPNLPTELDEILLHAMSFERDKRPADCAELEALCAAVMKTHNLVASDKDIARWVEAELRLLGPAYGGSTPDLSKSPVA